jgi:hypothetical protein
MRSANTTRQQPTITAAHLRGTLSVGLLQRKCACGSHTPGGGECESCKQNRSGLQRKADVRNGEGGVPTIVHDVLRSPGKPMDASSRAFFESRFGRDLSGVRLHIDAKAAASARAVDALAYTVGTDVVFGTGHYAPHTPTGRQLLAHELAHVIQQSNAAYPSGGPLRISEPSDPSERQADSVARDVMAGRSGGMVRGFPQTLARQAGGKKKCPAAHTIPDDVYKSMGEAWSKSGQGGATVTEHGGRIVTDAAGKRMIRTGAGGGGSISLPAEQAGDVTLGTFHTHPYSKSEGSTLGVSFSGGDIENFIGGAQGNVKYVHGGSCIFILDTLDSTARDGCKSVDIKKRWDDKFAAAGGNFQLKVDAAVRAAIAGCGLCYYGVCRPDAKSPVPKSAKLAGS